MKSEEEIIERLEHLDRSHVPQERGGYREKATIRALLWVLDEPEAYTMHGRSVYVDLFTEDNEEVRLVCKNCGAYFEENKAANEHIHLDHDWDGYDEKPGLTQKRVVVDE